MRRILASEGEGTCKNSVMSVEEDTARLLEYMDGAGLDASREITRGWDHIGAVLVDASLQRRQNYKNVVRPPVENLIAEWPDAATTTGFRRRLDSGALPDVISWRSPDRLQQINDLCEVLEDLEIETVDDLRVQLLDPDTRASVRSALDAVRHVGPKTLDYFDILVGIPTGVAIDVRIRRVAETAGLRDMSYRHLSAVIHAAASSRRWRPGDLDAVLWQSQP